MNFQIRPFSDKDLDEIVQLSLLAWEPVFSSFKQVLGPEIYHLVVPDWRTLQRERAEKVCQDKEKVNVLVAEIDGKVVGFLAYELRKEDATGEIRLLAVHPEFQNHGIGIFSHSNSKP
ncbi:MAG: GNAT family N-acetyltransferase [Chloroflexi bacterium]|nr:GNAT family N-acetyltransferase [Chloroflexota bacterium]MCI0578943.1 GNAT family N-acetyltransferase [Chloroflexota bacterium]MCI0646880.1 GNAT family N-acetyltransferase [Chloroflexota bacterium]MCI0730802.1 GNAT family N-acetyltransferase [Chloroflexota bacterium]